MNISELYSIFKKHPVATTDSRDCPPGSIFFALKGASFNGNAFAEKALEQGCSYAVIDEKEYYREGDSRYILTDDSLKTMQRLANHHRRELGTKIIGITGTNGKTTTKELVAAVLGEKYNVLHTHGNLNNEIGVPKTLLRLTGDNEIAVIEMGASHPGDIRTLTDIVEPDYGIITNVGKAHLKGFGSFEGVIRTKGELYDFIRMRHGKVFIDDGNEYLADISEGLELIKYGTDNGNDLFASGQVLSCDPFLNFRWRHGDGKWNEVHTHMIGNYNISNMLAAACIGLYFGVTQEQVGHALGNYIPGNSRSELAVTGCNRLIIDAYNANPTSMDAALKNFKDMEMSPKMAILGDMGELGDASADEHQKVVDFLKTSDIPVIWLVGEEFCRTECSFRKFKDVEEVMDEIRRHRPEGNCILIKGSNYTRLYRLPEYL